METKLYPLLSLSIITIRQVHDYLQLVFSDGSILNIFNRYNYNDSKDSKISNLVGQVVTHVQEEQTRIYIDFYNGSRFVIGLSSDDYNGPEALELIRKGEKLVIWT